MEQTIVSQAKSPTIFRLSASDLRGSMVGPDGAIGSGPAGRYALASISTFQESPRVRAQSRFEICRPNGAIIVSQAISPHDIPANPDQIYAEAGWAGYGRLARDRQGRSSVAPISTFQESPRFRARSRFEISAEWHDYCKSGKKPADIPANPNRIYAKMGWVGWGDWLGTGTVAARLRQYRPFKKARAFVRGLGLKSDMTNGATIVSQARSPPTFRLIRNQITRKRAGPAWGDWLGTGDVALTASVSTFQESPRFCARSRFEI